MNLYTTEFDEGKEASLYFHLNDAISTNNRVKAWLLYVKLFLTAVSEEEPWDGNIWRGVQESLADECPYCPFDQISISRSSLIFVHLARICKQMKKARKLYGGDSAAAPQMEL